MREKNMREILFRGKRVDNGEWVYGIYGTHSGIEALIIDRPYIAIDGTLCELRFWDVCPETVGQYTGLKDKNGKRIFEGDIVRYINEEDGYTELWRIVFKDYSLVMESIKERFSDCPVNYLETTEWYECIGNIHENPELLND